MVFIIGDIVKVKQCKYIEPDYWGALAIIGEIMDSEGYAIIHCEKDCDPEHISFKCKIECLEKVES